MIIDGYSQAAIQAAVDVLRRGDLVVMPTETVYGLAADASQASAVQKIFTRKQRPQTNPLIVHLANINQLADWAVAIPDVAYALAEQFWPGPMTLILTKAARVPDIVTANQQTIAVRIPAHPVALALLTAFGGGLAAPSANRFTQLSPTTAKHVALGEDMLVLDGGPAQVGIESTIIDCCGAQVTVLRPGMLAAAQISEVVGYEVVYQESHEVRRPGQHWLHYAPKAELSLCSTAELKRVSALAKTGFIIYSPELVGQLNDACLQLSFEPEAYARDLYAALHALDEYCQKIIVELPPVVPAWYAVHERLRKAAGVLNLNS